MASFASLVPKLRPTLFSLGLLGLTVIALRDGAHHDCGRPHVTLASLEASLARGPMTLSFESPSVDFWDMPATEILPLVRPPAHPDARPWPQGMVIQPPAIDGAIVLWDRSPLDSMLSALVAALGVLES